MKKIPPHAHQVFKGKIFEVWQWKQKLYNGATNTFECLKRPNTAEVIPVVGDKILIQIQKQPHLAEPFYSMPGGICDEEEKPLESAQRELLEETGYTSNDWTLWHEENPMGKIVWTVYTYIARTCAYQQAPHLDPGEKITNKLVTFDKLLALADDPAFRSKGLVPHFLRARYDNKEKAKLEHLFFKR